MIRSVELSKSEINMQYQFSGTLTDRDAKQHIALPFSMPDAMTELLVRFEYAPARVPAGLNALHLSLFDSFGFRGAGHRRGDRQAGLVLLAAGFILLRAERRATLVKVCISPLLIAAGVLLDVAAILIVGSPS
jgi:hypothetical protein